MNHTVKKWLCLIGTLSINTTALAQASTEPAMVEEMLVTGGKEAIQTLSGSAHIVSKEMLQQFDFTDLNQVMLMLPGVYIRQEDGYGLRPNIGIRGATSERSQKITLMEDGVLIAPAPYSSPAAYYIPNINRMSAVEVLKGPSAIRHGPHTVGGAINLATQPIGNTAEGFIDLGFGSNGFQKLRALYGNKIGDMGFWMDALHFGSDGFKELDNNGDTGFERNDINAKVQWENELLGYEQLLTLKLGYADETSDETYLGLTDSDFRQTPNRRYAASQLDRFDSEHNQLHLDHVIELGSNTSLNNKLYWNQFDRAWNKLDGFIDGLAIGDILARPEVFTREIQLLKGQINANNTAAETLAVTNNDRRYGSQGVQLMLRHDINTSAVNHAITAGLRYHHDYVERDHQTTGYLINQGVMLNNGIDYGNKTLNEAKTDAVAIFVEDQINWQHWTLTAGVRYEDISGEFTDPLNNTRQEKSQSIVIPGLGVFWQISDSIGLLAGVNTGFSPAGPGAGKEVDPEESINVEYGIRYQQGSTHIEGIGFFSDYDNLLGRCRVSDPSCTVGEEFNGGNVEVAGIEITGSHTSPLTQTWLIPISVSYTYTESAFQSAFASNFSQWGNVEKGDELPYTPKHSARLQVGLKSPHWDIMLAVNYQGKMRDQAGHQDINTVVHTDNYITADVSSTWHINQQILLQLTIDNITDEQAVVSYRPFGVRPNKPQSYRARVQYSF